MLVAIGQFTKLDSKPESPVLPEQRAAAEKYLQKKKALQYRHVQLRKLIADNKSKEDYLKKIQTALDKLFQYAANLLSPNPPRVWRTIKFATAFYHHHVKPVVGAKELLMDLGYSKDTGRTLEFEAEKPDIPKVTEITAELLVASMEIEKFMKEGLPLLDEGRSPETTESTTHKAQDPDVAMYGNLDSISSSSGPSHQPLLSPRSPPQQQPVSDVPKIPPVAKPRRNTSKSSGPTVGSTPAKRTDTDDDNDDDDESDSDEELQRLRWERKNLTKQRHQGKKEAVSKETKASPPQPTLTTATPTRDSDSEEYHDAQEAPSFLHSEIPPRVGPEGQSGSSYNVSPGSTRAQAQLEAPGRGQHAPRSPQGAVGPPRTRTDSPPKLEPLYAKNVAGAVGGHVGQGERGEDLACREQKGKGFEGEQTAKNGNLELSEFVDKRSPMTKEYKEMKKKEHEAREKKKRDEARQKELYDDGFFFMTWIRECVKYGYEPEDVEYAVNHYRNSQFRTPLEFLQYEWEDLKRIVQVNVARQGGVGKPSLMEARDFLLERGGSPAEAVEACVVKRREKIMEFLQQYPTASRGEAAVYLTRYRLNVEIAVSALQFDKLQRVVDFIWDDVKEGEPAELRRREEERLQHLIEAHREKNVQYCYHVLMGEYRLEDEDRASLVLELMKEGKAFGQCITLAQNCRTMEEVKRYTNQECPICFSTFMMDEMVTMLHCTCSTCKDCFREQYTMVAKEKGISSFNCLVCSKPDLGASDIDRDDYLTLFATLLKAYLDPENYQLFQKKTTEFALSKDDNFRWCAHCGCGFIHERPANRRIVCPHCNKDMCFHCKKKWEDQHRGISCKDFAKWKAENDEDNQQKGLAAFLKENGIECPKCKFRYDLAKGGCLHFKCTQCPTEFCGGCGAVFDKNCRKFSTCGTKGFHAHHPRDCLFYLRDWEVARLQKVLQEKNVEFDTEPPQKQVNAAQDSDKEDEEEREPEGPIAIAGAGQVLKCRVMLQKEVGSQKVDEECGDKCDVGHAGLCLKHYKEYLVCKINEEEIDPAEFMDVGEISATLMREDKQVPVKNAGEQDGPYLQRLLEHLKKEIELKKPEV
jgi:hypothetical protein